MADVLSQSEIDALLAAVSTGDVDTTPTHSERAEWIRHDFSQRERMLKVRHAALEGVHERFARNLRAGLSALLRKPVGVQFLNLDFFSFGEYASSILLPAQISVNRIAGIGSHVLLVCGAKLVYALLDSYYGGTELPFAKIGGREQFTSIEGNLVRKVTQIAIAELERAWRAVYPLTLEPVGEEVNPRFLGCIGAAESVAAVTLDVELENLSGPLIVVLQLRGLEPVQEALSMATPTDFALEAREWREHWMRELLASEIEINVELGRFNSSVGQLGNWKKGDVVTLMQDAVSPLTILIEGVPKLKGLMGDVRGSQAVRLVEGLRPVGGAGDDPTELRD